MTSVPGPFSEDPPHTLYLKNENGRRYYILNSQLSKCWLAGTEDEQQGFTEYEDARQWVHTMILMGL